MNSHSRKLAIESLEGRSVLSTDGTFDYIEPFKWRGAKNRWF